ncbi:MAG: hypothetical protein WBS22_01045, partial [Methylocystis sp.]
AGPQGAVGPQGVAGATGATGPGFNGTIFEGTTAPTTNTALPQGSLYVQAGATGSTTVNLYEYNASGVPVEVLTGSSSAFAFNPATHFTLNGTATFNGVTLTTNQSSSFPTLATGTPYQLFYNANGNAITSPLFEANSLGSWSMITSSIGPAIFP